MMTLCTVVPENYENYANILFKSVLRETKHISNALIAVPTTDKKNDVLEEWECRNIKFKKFYAHMTAPEHGHALGLHACIDLVETEFILFCDPDVFFYSPIDELYLQLMIKHNLNYIGCSHHSSVANAYSYFPYVMNSLVRKKDLPDENFLKGHLKFRNGCLTVEGLSDNGDLADGKYLISSPVPGFWHKLPNIKPNVFFDTSVNLCLWGIEQGWNWLSFQTADAHNYTTKYFRTNSGLKIRDRLPLQRLIYHDVRQSAEIMQKEYDKLLKEEEND